MLSFKHSFITFGLASKKEVHINSLDLFIYFNVSFLETELRIFVFGIFIFFILLPIKTLFKDFNLLSVKIL